VIGINFFQLDYIRAVLTEQFGCMYVWLHQKTNARVWRGVFMWKCAISSGNATMARGSW